MASSSKNLRLLGIALRVVLGVIFIYAGYVKLKDPWELFALAIASYQLLPLTMVEIVARMLPWLELIVGLMLIAGIWLRVAATITSLLLVVFFALMIRAYVKGMEIACGCFGPGEVISWKTLLRDGSMLAASLLLTSMAWIRQRKAA
jgi:putative oxidoreductase